MYVMIRRYRMRGSLSALIDQVGEQFVAQLRADGSGRAPRGDEPIRVPDGIVRYQAVVTGPDTVTTITAFDSRESLEAAAQGAAEIRRSLAAFEVEELETIAGDVRLDWTRAQTSYAAPEPPAVDEPEPRGREV